MLTGKEKSYLRSLAQTIKPIFQIGKDGITEQLVIDVLNYLNKHELMKVNILQNSDVDFDMAKAAFEAADIEVVQTIGKTVVLYKQSENSVEPIKFPKTKNTK